MFKFVTLLSKRFIFFIFYFAEDLAVDWCALHRVSCIIRALMNRLLAFWESSRSNTTTASPEKLQVSYIKSEFVEKSGGRACPGVKILKMIRLSFF